MNGFMIAWMSGCWNHIKSGFDSELCDLGQIIWASVASSV